MRPIASSLPVPVPHVPAVAQFTVMVGCTTLLLLRTDVVVPAPSFPRYAMSGRLRGARVIRTGLTAGGAVDGRAIADATTVAGEAR